LADSHESMIGDVDRLPRGVASGYKSAMRRVVAGRLGNRGLLRLPEGIDGLRPSSAKLRSAIFDRLQDEVASAVVLELCAGSGALSIEAISRGARYATLVESHPVVARFLRRQLDALQLGPVTELVVRDALVWLRAPPTRRYDLVLCDPPWAKPDLAAALLGSLWAGGHLTCGGLCAFEVPGRGDAASKLLAAVSQTGLQFEAERRYGDSLLLILRAPQ